MNNTTTPLVFTLPTIPGLNRLQEAAALATIPPLPKGLARAVQESGIIGAKIQRIIEQLEQAHHPLRLGR